MVTDPHTDTRTQTRTHSQDRLQYTALQLARSVITTSCARGDTICLRPLQVDNIYVFIHQVAPVQAFWLFKTSATS